MLQEEEYPPPGHSKSHQLLVKLDHLQERGKHRLPREENHYPRREESEKRECPEPEVEAVLEFTNLESMIRKWSFDFAVLVLSELGYYVELVNWEVDQSVGR
ncbi:hypothetical protein Tco_1284207 [Tanacetum coccineum]